MSLLSYFVDEQIKRFFPDVKRIRSKRGDVMLYSEQFSQIIYIKQSARKQPMNKFFLRQYQERNIRNMKRMMIGKFGIKEGKKQFTKSDKLDILIAEKVSQKIWRYLSALNRLQDSSTYNRKTFHFVFDKRKKTNQEIASIIYGALYKRIKKQLISILDGLRQKRKKDFNGKAFGNLKIEIEIIQDVCFKLEGHYYRLMGEKRIYDVPKVPEELNIIFHNLGKNIKNAEVIKK